MENPKKCEFFTKQFQWRKFLLSYEKPSLLGTAQCGNLQWLYLIYRTIVAVLWLAFQLYDWQDFGGAEGLIYLTFWTYTVLAVSSYFQLAAATYNLCLTYSCNKNVKDDSEISKPGGTPILYVLNWIFYYIGFECALIVTITYYTVLYNGGITFNDFVTHAMTSIYVLIDMFITGVPVRILHFYIADIFGIIYVTFTLIYWGAGGNGAIYFLIDWQDNAGLAVGFVFALILIGLPLFHMITFCLYWLRVLVYSSLCSCCNKKDEVVRPHTAAKYNGTENSAFEHGDVT